MKKVIKETFMAWSKDEIVYKDKTSERRKETTIALCGEGEYEKALHISKDGIQPLLGGSVNFRNVRPADRDEVELYLNYYPIEENAEQEATIYFGTFCTDVIYRKRNLFNKLKYLMKKWKKPHFIKSRK